MNEKLDEIFNSAKKAFMNDREPTAVELFKPYLKYRPNHGSAWLFYGAALQDIGRRKEAENAYLKALNLSHPQSRYIAQTRLGTMFYDWGNTEKAEYWFSRACRSKGGKSFGSLWIYRGCNYSLAGKFKKAEKCFLAATKMEDSDIDEAFYNLGNIYRAKGQYKEAKSAYKKALKIDPDYKIAKEALDSLKDIGKAIRKANSLKTKKGKHDRFTQ